MYPGNATDLASRSNAVSLALTSKGLATTTKLSSVDTELIGGQTTLLTSTVTAARNGTTPTGTVNFFLGTTRLGFVLLLYFRRALSEPKSFVLAVEIKSSEKIRSSAVRSLMLIQITAGQPARTRTTQSLTRAYSLPSNYLNLVRVSRTGFAEELQSL